MPERDISSMGVMGLGAGPGQKIFRRRRRRCPPGGARPAVASPGEGRSRVTNKRFRDTCVILHADRKSNGRDMKSNGRDRKSNGREEEQWKRGRAMEERKSNGRDGKSNGRDM